MRSVNRRSPKGWKRSSHVNAPRSGPGGTRTGSGSRTCCYCITGTAKVSEVRRRVWLEEHAFRINVTFEILKKTGKLELNPEEEKPKENTFTF